MNDTKNPAKPVIESCNGIRLVYKPYSEAGKHIYHYLFLKLKGKSILRGRHEKDLHYEESPDGTRTVYWSAFEPNGLKAHELIPSDEYEVTIIANGLVPPRCEATEKFGLTADDIARLQYGWTNDRIKEIATAINSGNGLSAQVSLIPSILKQLHDELSRKIAADTAEENSKVNDHLDAHSLEIRNMADSIRNLCEEFLENVRAGTAREDDYRDLAKQAYCLTGQVVHILPDLARKIDAQAAQAKKIDELILEVGRMRADLQGNSIGLEKRLGHSIGERLDGLSTRIGENFAMVLAQGMKVGASLSDLMLRQQITLLEKAREEFRAIITDLKIRLQDVQTSAGEAYADRTACLAVLERANEIMLQFSVDCARKPMPAPTPAQPEKSWKWFWLLWVNRTVLVWIHRLARRTGRVEKQVAKLRTELGAQQYLCTASVLEKIEEVKKIVEAVPQAAVQPAPVPASVAAVQEPRLGISWEPSLRSIAALGMLLVLIISIGLWRHLNGRSKIERSTEIAGHIGQTTPDSVAGLPPEIASLKAPNSGVTYRYIGTPEEK